MEHQKKNDNFLHVSPSPPIPPMYLVEVNVILRYVSILNVVKDVILALPEPAGCLGVQSRRCGVGHPCRGHKPCLHPDSLKAFININDKTDVHIIPEPSPGWWRVWWRSPQCPAPGTRRCYRSPWCSLRSSPQSTSRRRWRRCQGPCSLSCRSEEIKSELGQGPDNDKPMGW